MKLKGLSLFANVGIAETYLKEVGVNFILATPPCQGMSIAGQMKEDDPRNSLIIKAMEAFELLQPVAMLIENVPQMYKTSILVNGVKINIKDYVQSICDKLGYNVKFDIFDAADYGTAQSRKKFFTRIYSNNYSWNEPIKESVITVRDKIADLPSIESNEKSNIPLHYGRRHIDNHILWMKHTPSGKSAFQNPVYYPQKNGRKIKGFTTTYKRISWDKPAPTITMTSGCISSQNNVHPGRLKEDGTYSDARALSILELLRLTGLPDDWNIPSWAKENFIREVIGEAIPPILVKNIVKMLKKN